MRIKIIATGGTIDKIYFDALSAFHVGEPQVGEVLSRANVGFEYEVVGLMRKDSLDLTDADRRLIRATIEASAERHFVVTHGTDTMAQTAQFVQDVPGKVIVFTGAMQPARFRQTDAVFNIASAVTAVQLLAPGAYIAMNGRVLAAADAVKNRVAGRFERRSDAPVAVEPKFEE